ncbi:hypothetical protein J6590_068609 [Homalodisca vitripennis]|nr:hypothetical protein J6590_068609 [Homalodisca vitripennis]
MFNQVTLQSEAGSGRRVAVFPLDWFWSYQRQSGEITAGTSYRTARPRRRLVLIEPRWPRRRRQNARLPHLHSSAAAADELGEIRGSIQSPRPQWRLPAGRYRTIHGSTTVCGKTSVDENVL